MVAALTIALIGPVAGCERDRQAGLAATTAPPTRVISLTPSGTETMAALGALDLLVGVDDYSTYPPQVTALPKVGSFVAPSFEAILGLRPDLVIIDDVHGELAAALQGAGIATQACPMHALPDVRRCLEALGARIGRPAAATAAVRRIDDALHAAGLRKHSGRRPRVLAVIDREAGGLGGMVVAATGSWLDELLAIVGAENVMIGAGVRYPRISAEEILRSNPSVIIDVAYSAEQATAAHDWAPLADVPAVARGRVVVAKEPFLMAPSPRVPEALQLLDSIIYSDAADAAPAADDAGSP